jgi:hypothetical protein
MFYELTTVRAFFKDTSVFFPVPGVQAIMTSSSEGVFMPLERSTIGTWRCPEADAQKFLNDDARSPLKNTGRVLISVADGR